MCEIKGHADSATPHPRAFGFVACWSLDWASFSLRPAAAQGNDTLRCLLLLASTLGYVCYKKRTQSRPWMSQSGRMMHAPHGGRIFYIFFSGSQSHTLANHFSPI
jgi:hypothetical protein